LIERRTRGRAPRRSSLARPGLADNDQEQFCKSIRRLLTGC
jgi:hypothetical protein